MIGVQEAVKAAIQFLLDIDADGQPSDIRVEEIESDDERSLWFVTLGFVRSADRQSLDETLGGGRPRHFKRFDVDGKSGKVMSMKFAKAS